MRCRICRRRPRKVECFMFSRCLKADLSAGRVLVAIACAALLVGCQRESRQFEAPPNSDAEPTQVAISGLVAGQSSTAFRKQQQENYENNAYHMSEGKRLFTWFNCVGCHAHGGGDIGPPLMDDKWIYGGEIDQIYLTIAQGRPNGMPAFAGKIPPQQIWQLAAYVRSMSGQGPKAARSARTDHMRTPAPQEARPTPLARAA